MSRSFKKTRIVKDGNKHTRALGHRKFRRKNNDEEPPMKIHEVQNQYDVVDWKFVDNLKKWFGKGKDKKIWK